MARMAGKLSRVRRMPSNFNFTAPAHRNPVQVQHQRGLARAVRSDQRHLIAARTILVKHHARQRVHRGMKNAGHALAKRQPSHPVQGRGSFQGLMCNWH